MKEKLLEKLLELLTQLPDKDDELGVEPKEEGSLEIIGVGGKPLDEKKVC